MMRLSSLLNGAGLALVVTTTLATAPAFAMSGGDAAEFGGDHSLRQFSSDDAYYRRSYHPYYGYVHFYHDPGDKGYDFGYGFGCAIERLPVQTDSGSRWANVKRCY